jgi:hypothetical protein
MVTDLTVSGCYVDTRSMPGVGNRAEFDIHLPGGVVSVHGTVRHGVFGVGFAVEFEELDYDTRERIASAVEATRIRHATSLTNE